MTKMPQVKWQPFLIIWVSLKNITAGLKHGPD